MTKRERMEEKAWTKVKEWESKAAAAEAAGDAEAAAEARRRAETTAWVAAAWMTAREPSRRIDWSK